MGIYPRTIKNGAGEQLTFCRLVEDAGGNWLEVENVVQPGGGPPMHIHFYQEESLSVIQGRIGYERPGEEPQFAEAGETVVFKPGEPHRFWNAGEVELRCKGYVKPADNIEYFLSALYASQAGNGGGRPDPFDVAYLAHRYKSEFAVLVVPPFVQRFIFPVQVAIGKLLGKYGKYADAPAPVRR